MKGWYGDKYKHSLTSRGIKVSMLRMVAKGTFNEYDVSKDPITRNGKKILYKYYEESGNLIYRNPVDVNGCKIFVWFVHDMDEDNIPTFRKPTNNELNDIIDFLQEMNKYYPNLLEYLEENKVEIRFAKDMAFNKMRNEKKTTVPTGKNMGYADGSIEEDRWLLLRVLNSRNMYDYTYGIDGNQIFADVFWHEFNHIKEDIHNYNLDIEKVYKYGWDNHEPSNEFERSSIKFENEMIGIMLKDTNKKFYHRSW